jgi:hypothetical protein
MQRKLTANEVIYCEKAANGLVGVCCPEGEEEETLARLSLAFANMAYHETSDGKPWVEPPLTDEDAKQRPWVMVRDNKAQPWCGPKVLAYVERNAIGPREYLDTAGVWWHHARKATAEEIPAREKIK